jgi:hypothetical protein
VPILNVPEIQRMSRCVSKSHKNLNVYGTVVVLHYQKRKATDLLSGKEIIRV